MMVAYCSAQEAKEYIDAITHSPRIVPRPKIYARCDLWRASYSRDLIMAGYEEVFYMTAPPVLSLYYTRRF